MSTSITMTYGGVDISPVPLVNIRRETTTVKNRDDHIAYKFVMTLTGVLTPLPDNATGLVNTIPLMTTLRETFASDCEALVIKCDDAVLLSCSPRVVDISFQESNNNWVDTIPYTIVLEYDFDDQTSEGQAATSPYIEEVSEEWNFEFVQDHRYFYWDLRTVTNQEAGYDYAEHDGNNPYEANVTRTISVVGKRSCLSGEITYGVQNAINWLTGVYGLDDYSPDNWGHAVPQFTNLDSGVGSYNLYDHYRSHIVDETNGSIRLTDSWLVVGANTGITDRDMREDFTVSVLRPRDEDRISITVDGQIQGFERRTYSSAGAKTPVISGDTAYENAAAAWTTIQDRIFPRAQAIFQQESETTRNLHPTPLNKSVGHQTSKGVIIYSYEFDDRLCSFIEGSLSENITIIDDNSTDVFASFTIPGRQKGQILQSINTFTNSSRQVSVEVIMPRPTACNSIADLELNNPSTNVKNLICQYESGLTGSYDQVFKTNDSENWNPLTGRFSRSVSWTYAGCSGDNIVSSVCSG